MTARPPLVGPAAALAGDPALVDVDGRRLECRVFAPGANTPARRDRGVPRVVLLHEGLGCVAMWRDFPAQLADRLGEPVLAYSRYGYGASDVLAEPRTDRF